MYACKYLTLFESSRLHFQLYPKKRPLQEHPLTLPPSWLAAWQPLQLPKFETHACPRGSVCKEFHLTAMHACIHKWIFVLTSLGYINSSSYLHKYIYIHALIYNTYILHTYIYLPDRGMITAPPVSRRCLYISTALFRRSWVWGGHSPFSVNPPPRTMIAVLLLEWEEFAGVDEAVDDDNTSLRRPALEFLLDNPAFWSCEIKTTYKQQAVISTDLAFCTI